MSITRKTDTWLEEAYGATSGSEIAEVYSKWADTYDADMLATGYLHMPVITGLITRHVPRRDAAILDAGVGTGTLGGILSILGYNNLSGLDLSDAMLAKARARRCYSDLKERVLGEALDYTSASFDAIVSTGTFTTGHAPAAAFDELVRILEPDGVLMFTVGTVVWEEQGFKAKLAGFVSAGTLAAVETTPVYCPMPFSGSESGFTTRAHVYRKG